jgi:hypothetical protein
VTESVRDLVAVGFRMRKSMKIAPGVRLNVSKSGVGASVGGRGGRYSVHSSGRRTVSAGSGIVPGVYYQKSLGGSRLGEAHAVNQTSAHPGNVRDRLRPARPRIF